MQPTHEDIQHIFTHYNRLIFGGSLPPIPIRLSDATTFLGMMVSKVKRLPGGIKKHYDFQLRINTRFDLPEEVVHDTVIHEMIHYYIAYNGLRDTSAHGRLFRGMMKDINKKYGRQISVSHRQTQLAPENVQNQKKRWHIIAVVDFQDGKKGVKVLPRSAVRVAEYDKRLKTSAQIKEVSYWLHNHPWFDRFPVSVAMKVHIVDLDHLKGALKDARLLGLSAKNGVPSLVIVDKPEGAPQR